MSTAKDSLCAPIIQIIWCWGLQCEYEELSHQKSKLALYNWENQWHIINENESCLRMRNKRVVLKVKVHLVGKKSKKGKLSSHFFFHSWIDNWILLFHANQTSQIEMAYQSFQQEYMQIPPITRAYTTACVLTTTAVVSTCLFVSWSCTTTSKKYARGMHSLSNFKFIPCDPQRLLEIIINMSVCFSTMSKNHNIRDEQQKTHPTGYEIETEIVIQWISLKVGFHSLFVCAKFECSTISRTKVIEN